MTQRISGPGLGLPLAQNLYPSELGGAAQDAATNSIALAAGDVFVIPAGDWWINPGLYSVLQFLDPITNAWSMGPNAAWAGGHQFVVSDGYTTRLANLTGCPVSATITQQGGSYVQSSTTIVAVGQTSTWLPIVGGALAVVGGTLTSNGAGYGVPPIVLIPSPPPASNNANGVGGTPASAYATIANGTVSAISFTSVGSGYPTAPTPVLVPSPFDPNLATGITHATLAFSLTNAGQLTGAICTNNGNALTTITQITLTVAGAGTNATLVPNMMATMNAASVTGAGSGYGTLQALLTTVGGAPSVGTIAGSADNLRLAWRPRPAQVGLTVTAAANGTIAAQNGAIYDGGLFQLSGGAAPGFVIATQPLTATTAAYVSATLALTYGPLPDRLTLQPAA